MIVVKRIEYFEMNCHEGSGCGFLFTKLQRSRDHGGYSSKEGRCCFNYGICCWYKIKITEYDHGHPSFNDANENRFRLQYRQEVDGDGVQQTISHTNHNKHLYSSQHEKSGQPRYTGLPMAMQVQFTSDWIDKPPAKVVNFFMDQGAIGKVPTKPPQPFIPTIGAVKRHLIKKKRDWKKIQIAPKEQESFAGVEMAIQPYIKDMSTIEDDNEVFVVGHWIDSRRGYIAIILSTLRLLFNMYLAVRTYFFQYC